MKKKTTQAEQERDALLEYIDQLAEAWKVVLWAKGLEEKTSHRDKLGHLTAHQRLRSAVDVMQELFLEGPDL